MSKKAKRSSIPKVSHKDVMIDLEDRKYWELSQWVRKKRICQPSDFKDEIIATKADMERALDELMSKEGEK